VSDNGVGLKEDFEIDKSDTLGIQLIKTLTEQLGGTFKINKDEGTSFIVRFHLENQTA
jgi:two-component sensor histidine kinase